MTVLRRGEKTADELLAELNNDSDYVAMRARQEAEWVARREEGRMEEAMLLADLRRVGFTLSSVWDFVNTADSYPEAIPVLLDHLRRSYSAIHREGMARALSVREARGIAGPAMIALLRDPEVVDQSLRWALANALVTVADRDDRDAIKELIDAEPEGEVQKRLKRALKAAAKIMSAR